MRKESTTTTMKRRGFISTLAVFAALLTSCSSDSDFSSNNGNANTDGVGVTAEAPSKKEVDVDATRSVLDYDKSKNAMSFRWEATDHLTVFAEGNDMSKQIYSIIQQTEYGNKAHFTSKDFKLTEDKRYFTLSKTEEERPGGPDTKIPDQRNITIDFSGQKQLGNGSPAHLGKYDFMAASQMSTDPDQIHFDFQHLGATLRLKVRLGDSGDSKYASSKFTSAELYSADNSFRQPVRSFNLTSGVGSDGTYTPRVSDPDPNGTGRFTLDLADYTNHEVGIQPASEFKDGTTSTDNGLYDLILYIEVPPADLRTTSMGLILHGKDSGGNEITYYATRNGFNIEAGKLYNVPFVVKQTTNYTVTLKVNHLWQNGTTTATTRATGDPGYDKDLKQPQYIYYAFGVGGKIRAVQGISGESEAKAVNTIHVTGTDDDKWTLDEKTFISSYGKKVSLTTTDADKDKKKQIFVIASDYELPASTFDGIANETPIGTLLAKTYAIESPTNQTTSQAFLRDLYSTPWVSETAPFVGDLTDPMQDVILYHVAAKVDLKWNSTKEMTVGSGSDIKVSNVKSTGLLLFKPTMNTNTTGDYTVTTPITYGTFINGRQVYYLPQFSDNQYKVTIGSVNYIGGESPNKPIYEFTGTSTDGGFTSWYRALIQQ